MVTLPCGNILYSAETGSPFLLLLLVLVVFIIIIIIIIILWSHVGGCDVLIIVVCGGWKNAFVSKLQTH